MKSAIDAIIRGSQAAYLDKLLPPRDELLTEMELYAAESGQPIADAEVAQLMRILVRTARPQRLIEVGTNIGYSVVVVGRECPSGSTFETIEIDRATLDVARSFVQRAELPCNVVFHEGAALDVLTRLDGPFDFAFIDCVKTEYIAYLDLLLPRMSRGGLVVADNVLWKGQVAESPRDEREVANTEHLRTFNERIMSDPRLTSIVLPFGDGLSISIVN